MADGASTSALISKAMASLNSKVSVVSSGSAQLLKYLSWGPINPPTTTCQASTTIRCPPASIARTPRHGYTQPRSADRHAAASPHAVGDPAAVALRLGVVVARLAQRCGGVRRRAAEAQGGRAHSQAQRAHARL